MPPKNSSVFSRWNKASLLDLIEKLKVDDVPYSIKKTELIQLLEDYLASLKEPLNDVIEFPELLEYYSAKSSETVPEEQQEETQTEVAGNTSFVQKEELVSLADTSKGKMSNFIDFTKLLGKKSTKKDVDETQMEAKAQDEENSEEEDDDEEYKLTDGEVDSDSEHDEDLEDELDELLNIEDYNTYQKILFKLKQFNEDVQDHLSTVYTIAFLMFIVEFSFFFKHIVEKYLHCKDPFQNCQYQNNLMAIVTNLSLWSLISILIPCLISYYINFIRYDLPSMEIDPMIFSLAKIIIFFILSNADKSTHNIFNCKTIDIFINIYNVSLNQIPFWIGIIGCVLTLYIF